MRGRSLSGPNESPGFAQEQVEFSSKTNVSGAATEDPFSTVKVTGLKSSRDLMIFLE
jgi:hypothetical protein